MDEQNPRKRGKNVSQVGDVAKKSKGSTMLHEEENTFKESFDQSVLQSLAEAATAKVQPAQPIQQKAAIPMVEKPNYQEQRGRYMAVNYRRHPNYGKQEENASSETRVIQPVALMQKENEQTSDDGSNSGIQNVQQSQDGMKERRIFIGDSPLPQETVQELLYYLRDATKMSPSFLKLHNVCKSYRKDKKISTSITLLGDGVKRRLLQDATSEDTKTAHTALTLLYQFEIPITRKVEEKIGLYGQVNDQQQIEEYLSEDQSFCLGQRDPKPIFQFMEEICETQNLTFGVSDLTELFFYWRQNYTQLPIRLPYLENRMSEVLSNFKMGNTSNMDLAVKVMMLTDSEVNTDFKKRANGIGRIQRNLQNKIILYQPHSHRSKIIAKSNLPREINKLKVYQFIINYATPKEDCSLKINSLMALNGLCRAMNAIDKNVFRPFLVLVEVEMNSTPETKEVEIEPMKNAIRNFLQSMKEHMDDVGPLNDKFPAGLVYVSLSFFVSGLKCPSLQDLLQELLSEKEIYQASMTVLSLSQQVCFKGLMELFSACK